MTATAMLETPEGKAKRESDDQFREAFREIYRPIVKRTVPEKYLEFTLNDLKPSEKSRLPLDQQQALYDEMRAHPLDGWAFFAPAGYSKTVSSTALYRSALVANLLKWWPLYAANDYQAFEWPKETGPGVKLLEEIPRIYAWRKSVPDLLQQHFDMFNYREGEGQSRPPKPDITVERIQEGLRRGLKPRVFLEEIDKIKPSEFSINQIFRLFDALDRHPCQLVLDTNLSTAQFTDMFGEPIARRVKENCHVKEYGF